MANFLNRAGWKNAGARMGAGGTAQAAASDVAGETLLGAAVEGGAEVGGTVGAAGGFEIPVWGWIATGVAVAGGVGYGVYKHYHNKHEADGAAQKQGFKDSVDALDTAKAGFKNSGELHFVDEQIKKAGLGNDLHDYAQKHGHNTLEDFIKTSGHKTGHEYARSWGYKTPGERAQVVHDADDNSEGAKAKRLAQAVAIANAPEAQREMAREAREAAAHQRLVHTHGDAHPAAHTVRHFDVSTLPAQKAAQPREIVAFDPPELVAASAPVAVNVLPASVLEAPQLPPVSNRPSYRSSLGNNLANDGTGKLDGSALQNEGAAKVRQWDANGMHMAVVDVKDHGKHIVDTSVESAEGTRTTHTVNGKMQWSVVNLKQTDGSVVVASNQQRDPKGKLVEQATAAAGTSVAASRFTAPRVGM